MQRRFLVSGLLILWLSSLSIATFAEQTRDKNTFVIAIYHPMMVNPIQGTWAVRKHIIEQAGYRVEYRVVPSKRMAYELRNGNVDAISVSNLARSIQQQKQADSFLQAQYPDRVTVTHIYYREGGNWQPSWPATGDFFSSAKGITINFNYLAQTGMNLHQIPGYQSGVLMVNNDRADYWLDNIPHYSPTFNKFKKAETEGFVKAKLFDNPLFLLFADTARGNEFKQIIDEGMVDLLRNADEFRGIWNDNQQVFTDSVDEYLDYMLNTYPELKNKGQLVFHQ